MRILLISLLLLFMLHTLNAQERPKLVVGIVVDQMKEDYLYRFQRNYTENGFKRLMREGAEVKNMHYNYVPTYTGPGHASVYTGTTPALHGIIGNDWYSRQEEEMVYCVRDNSVNSIGTTSGDGKASPHRLLTTTITDELKLSTGMEAKVMSISIKDRGAILPGGHTGQAYWYDYPTGRFITSSFYRNNLPDWLNNFNNQKYPDQYLNQTWDRLLPAEAYITDRVRYAEYEKGFVGKKTPDFPYELKKYKKNYNYDLVVKTPFGNDLLTDLAKETIRGEQLGQDDITDFLAVSFSTPDIIGHDFGPQSQEVEDTYYRLDRNIADLLNYLDEKVGKENYLLFLTADHAVADVPLYMNHEKIPAGLFSNSVIEDRLDSLLQSSYGKGKFISSISNYQVFLDHKAIRKANVNIHEMQQLIADYLIDDDNDVAYAWTAGDIHQSAYDERGLKGGLVRGYHQKRSGDVLFAPFPGWFAGSDRKGTTHGSPFTYDTHVPMLWYGWKIPNVQTVEHYEIPDIATTLSLLLNIRMPNATTGRPIKELFSK